MLNSPRLLLTSLFLLNPLSLSSPPVYRIPYHTLSDSSSHMHFLKYVRPISSYTLLTFEEGVRLAREGVMLPAHRESEIGLVLVENSLEKSTSPSKFALSN